MLLLVYEEEENYVIAGFWKKKNIIALTQLEKNTKYLITHKKLL